MTSEQLPIIPIYGVIKNYPWGSYTTLALHRGESRSDEPEAELWFGDNPQGPSPIVNSNKTVDSVTAQSGRLPFLAKILAVEHSLSLQVHPALSDVEHLKKVLKDDNHKPEMIIALTEFHALVGFASIDEILTLLAQLDSPKAYEFLAEPIRAGSTLVELLEKLLGISDTEGILDEVLAKIGNLDSARSMWLLELIELYSPKLDPLAFLLCQFVILEPGESLYLPPRCIHAYLHGTAVEVMANSDNVIRGGLTNKPIDKANFLSLVGRSPARGERITPQVRDGVHQWRAPVEDFLLHNIEGEINQGLTLTDWAIAFVWRGSVDVSPQRSGGEVIAQESISQSKGALLAPGEYLFKGSGSLWVVSGKGR